MKLSALNFQDAVKYLISIFIYILCILGICGFWVWMFWAGAFCVRIFCPALDGSFIPELWWAYDQLKGSDLATKKKSNYHGKRRQRQSVTNHFAIKKLFLGNGQFPPKFFDQLNTALCSCIDFCFGLKLENCSQIQLAASYRLVMKFVILGKEQQFLDQLLAREILLMDWLS